jgi:rod shape-determining protein MreD
MTRRFLVLCLLGYAMVVVQASIQALLPLRVLVPELGLLVALYAGLTAQQGVSGACAVALLLGYVTDLLAGAPKGLHAMVFVLACLLAKGASLRLMLSSSFIAAVFSFFVSLLSAVLIVATRAQIDHSTMGPLAIAPVQALVSAIFAPLVFGILSRATATRARA